VVTQNWPNCDGVLVLTTQTYTNQYSLDSTWTTAPGIKITAITDGTSNTLVIGERGPSPNLHHGRWSQYALNQDEIASPVYNTGVYPAPNVGSAPTPPATKYTSNGGVQPPGVTATACPFPAVFGPGNPSNGCDFNHIWSPHTGGANFLFADGHVNFLTYSITATNPGGTNPNAPTIIQALETRAGGEIVTLPN
jgi:prepilin-type processing-associated H-X9-DG protein